MAMLAARLISVAIGYIFGLFQTAYLYGRANGIDIRKLGSGNAGTTNAMRSLGKKAGIITFSGDFLKTIAAMLLVWLIFHEKYPEYIKLIQMYAGFGAVLGHNYPCYLKFKGGKGIACTGAFLFAFYPPIFLVSITIFALIVIFAKYVSLGSIVGVAAFVIQLLIYGQTGHLIPEGGRYLYEFYVVGVLFFLLALWQHRENIKRLLNGTEHKVGGSKAL
ncbi:glycerol-3-phosphate acyltransferase [Clostridia bacterium]|nr:glycerol-3-phosphate acyltransferase [Clostridia bacterium]